MAGSKVAVKRSVVGSVRNWRAVTTVVVPANRDLDGSLRTRQEFAQEADINYIVRQAVKTQTPPTWLNDKQALFADVSRVPSLAEAFEIKRRAEELFLELPSTARAELGNDPTRLLEADSAFMKRHGLLKPVAASAATDGVEGGTPSPAKPGAAPRAANTKSEPKAKAATESDDE